MRQKCKSGSWVTENKKKNTYGMGCWHSSRVERWSFQILQALAALCAREGGVSDSLGLCSLIWVPGE